MTSPPRVETPRERLARLMDERRDDLELHWNEVAELAGLTREGLRKIRYGIAGIQTTSKHGLEKALHWERGSINAILAGGNPTPIQGGNGPGLKAVPEKRDELLESMVKDYRAALALLQRIEEGLGELRRERETESNDRPDVG